MKLKIIHKDIECKCGRCNEETSTLYAFEGQEKIIKYIGMCALCFVEFIMANTHAVELPEDKVEKPVRDFNKQ